jgi:hypothetical protein
VKAQPTVKQRTGAAAWPTGPVRPEARGHPVHERLLELQRTAGNQAVVQLAKGTKPPPVTAEELSALGTRIAKAAHDVVGTPAAADLFGVIAAQVRRTKPQAKAPKHKPDDPLAAVYTELYAADTRAVLARLESGQRTDLLNSLLDALIPALGGGTPVHAPDKATDNATAAAADEHLVSARIKSNCEKGWASVRRTLLAAFGALEVGPEAAINRANAFYQQLVPAKLLGVSGTLVHPDMQAAFDAATTWLTAQPGVDLDAIRADMGRPGGFNIRANRNNPIALSEHSFGFAVDLRASLNPNIGRKGAALDAVADATGVDPRTMGTAGASAAQVMAVAASLRTASASYVAVMSDPALFTRRIRVIVDGVRVPEGLLRLDDAGAAALSELLRTEGKKAPKADRIASAAFPSGTPTDRQHAAVASLLRMAIAWRAANPASGKRPAAQSEATVGSVAAHGFLSLPPSLVAALSGREGGALTWLGTSGVHDYMHFELPPSRRPKLY